METLAFRLEGDSSGRVWPIVGDVHLPTSPDAGAIAPVIAIAHGWLGHKDQGFLPDLARGLAAAGFTAVRFSFSGSGVPPGADEIRDVEKFGANTFGREVEDLERVVTAIFERILPGRERFDIARIGVLGYDAGGAVALIEAARDSRVKAVAAIAAPERLDDVFPPRAWDQWIARGEYALRDPRSGRTLRVGRAMERDLRAATDPKRPATEAPADVLPAARALEAPYIVIHGEADERTPLESAHRIFFQGTRAELEVIAGADHALEPATEATARERRPGAAGAGAEIARAVAARFFEKSLR